MDAILVLYDSSAIHNYYSRQPMADLQLRDILLGYIVLYYSLISYNYTSCNRTARKYDCSSCVHDI